MPTPEETTVLVVDDEADARAYMSAILEDEGYKVVTAADGQEALERLEESKPALISLDLVMPKLSGYKLHQKLKTKREWRGIPVLIVTGHARDDLGHDDFEKVTTLGNCAYLEKPIKAAQYLEAVEMLLAGEAADA